MILKRQDDLQQMEQDSPYWRASDIIFRRSPGHKIQRKTPLSAQNMSINPGPNTWCRRENFYFCYPLPYIFDLVCGQSIWLFHTAEQLFTWTAFYPVSGLTMKRTAVSQTAYYPVTLFLVHIFIIFICMFTMLIFILPKIMSFILLNPQGGCRGWFFF